MPLSPSTLAELADAVRSTACVLAVGARTKPRLSEVEDDVVLLSTRSLTGIIEYDPSEFTFTALAGTAVREIAAALAERGQYLPFDPLLLDAGATLGGTVAAGLSGPGRFRFGGLRNFILCVRFVDGAGRLLRLGGKVVKNAAGFDVPKFMVGSLGRFGVLAEITFKVFPRITSTRTLRITLGRIDDAITVLPVAANTRWEIDALDLESDRRSVLLRLAAPAVALDAISHDILERWSGDSLSVEEAQIAWTNIREFRWADPNAALIKVPTTAAQLSALYRATSGNDDDRIHVSAGGDVAFIASSKGVESIDAKLRELGLRGLTLRGAGPLWCGVRPQTQIARAVKEALDPHGRFPALDQ